jgi:hypothetical protein
MSHEALPITPARFAEALQDLSLASLHLKVLEIRNAIAHLDYSNEQLKPFAEGTAPDALPNTTSSTATNTASASSDATTQAQVPDQDCIDAIRENEAVIARMNERIALIRTEVESRGASWTEFQSKEEAEEMARAGRERGRAAATNGEDADDEEDEEDDGDDNAVNRARESINGGIDGTSERPTNGTSHPAWSDGTFQTGTIRDGEARMNQRQAGTGPSGRFTDEELARAMEERMRELGVGEEEDEDEGLHL